MKVVNIVHAIDTEGPLYEPLDATFERLAHVYQVTGIKSSRENLEGIMSVNNNQDYGDEDGDGDVDQDDFIFKYFDKTGETLQAGAGGVQDLMSSIRERISNIFS